MKIAFGKRIKNLRLARNWTREDLADILDVSPDAIAQTENRDGKPRTATVRRMAQAFRVSPEELLSGTPFTPGHFGNLDTDTEPDNSEMDEFKLCYAEGNFAVFAPADPVQVSGEDWGKKPIGKPQFYPAFDQDNDGLGQDFMKVAFELPGYEVNNQNGHTADDMNAGLAPWLFAKNWKQDPAQYKPIPAGTKYADFVNFVLDRGGMVYVPMAAE